MGGVAMGAYVIKRHAIYLLAKAYVVTDPDVIECIVVLAETLMDGFWSSLLFVRTQQRQSQLPLQHQIQTSVATMMCLMMTQPCPLARQIT